MTKNDYINIKPHHFLDIIKLYGAGLNYFIPDKKYNHDFYKIGNLIINSPNIKIKLTHTNDDICMPCVFYKNNECSDKIENFKITSKNVWNKVIDSRLLKILNVNENQLYTSLELCEISKKHLNELTIKKIWRERPLIETDKRITYLTLGLNKYLNINSKYSITNNKQIKTNLSG